LHLGETADARPSSGQHHQLGATGAERWFGCRVHVEMLNHAVGRGFDLAQLELCQARD
jgi:hypothetical protein